MREIPILSPYEAKEFDAPPLFNKKLRQQFFALDSRLERQLKKLRTVPNKIGFLLQFGYFKAVGRFYLPQYYAKADIYFIAKLLGLEIKSNVLDDYPPRTRQQHQKMILKQTAHRAFVQSHDFFIDTIRCFVEKQMHPRNIFDSVIDTLSREQIEVPTYHQLQCHISQIFSEVESQSLDRIAKQVTTEQRNVLDELTATDNEYYQRSLLTRIKTINQSIEPARIKQSLHGFLIVKRLYRELESLITALALSPEAAKYYGQWVIKAKMTQINAIVDPQVRYLYLLGFISHQFKIWHDTLLEVALRCDQGHRNKIEQLLGTINTEKLPKRNQLAQSILNVCHEQQGSLNDVRNILYHEKLNNNQKVHSLAKIVPPEDKEVSQEITNTVDALQQQLNNDAKKQDYYAVVTGLSQKYQNRVAGIIQHLDFDMSNTPDTFKEALLHYQQSAISKTSPHDFLTELEREAVFKDDGFTISLYKALFLMKVTEHIKSRTLCLNRSYRYLALEAYLVDKHYWLDNKDKLLREAGLTDFADCNSVLTALEKKLDPLFYNVNKRIVTKQNIHVTLKKDGTCSLRTPAVDKPDYEPIIEMIGKDRYIPILQMIAETNALAHFTDCFKHHKNKDAKQKPSDETFYGGIFALGSNVGLHKLGNTAMGINHNTLDNTVNWYFSLGNLHAVNKKLTNCMRKLWLANQFKKEQSSLHTSGDAQKRCVSIESLYANYSFKYFGKGKGANVYTFIDERGILFYSTVFSSAERDAAYVIDGLLHNDAIKSDMHSTDTHGYSSLVFSITHFIDAHFAPRIKDVMSQHLVAFKKIRRDLTKKNYPIKPTEYVNAALIKQHWDDILRLLVSIKLKDHRPSTILKRLNAQDNPPPLQLALQEFGKIIKSIFILNYMDDVALRQTIEKQLNKGELANRFNNAVSFANKQEILQSEPDDQQVAALCKVIIQNIIILWNYTELTKLLMRTDEDKRAELLTHITNGSIITWAHVNMLGVYDFRDLLSHNDTHYVTNEELLGFKAA